MARQRVDNLSSHRTETGWAAVADDRKAAPARLNERFRGGQPPSNALDGQYVGLLLTTSFGHGIDQATNAMARLYMPWRGKVFNAAAQSGGNLFTPLSKRMIRPFYPAVHEHQSGMIYAHPFRTYTGPGIIDSDMHVLKIDYDLPANRFGPIRRVLDELVEVTPGYYLGKAHLRLRGHWHTVAYFSLQLPGKSTGSPIREAQSQ